MAEWRFIAQNVLSGEFLEWELPLSLSGLSWDLSGPGSLSATISPEFDGLRNPDGTLRLKEWETAIYAESDGIIRWGGLLIRSSFNGADWSIECAGFSSYPNGRIYNGNLYSKIKVDPTTVFKDIWDYVQSKQDGDLGVNITLPGNCPVRIGEPAIPAYKETQMNGIWYNDADLKDAGLTDKVVASTAGKLAKGIDANDTTVVLQRLEGFGKIPMPYTVTIGSEQLRVTARSGLKLTVTRGYSTTSGAAHSSGTAVKFTGTPTRTVDKVDAQPYELNWWDSIDCGSELDKLAQETPFDYLEEHYWTAATAGSALPIGYGNLMGGYDDVDKGWMATRAEGQADLINSMGVAMFAAVELHETASTAMPRGAHRWFEDRLKVRDSDWTLADGGVGGNHLLYKAGVVDVLGVAHIRGASDLRWVSDFTVKHRATSAQFHVIVTHFHADDNNGTSRAPERVREAQFIADYTRDMSPCMVLGDFNSATLAAGFPKSIMATVGLKGLQQRSVPTNTTLNSHGTGTGGSWIDDMLTREAEFVLTSTAGVLTNGLSDHQLWLTMTATLNASSTVSPKTIGHRITVGYPRLGRRRSDLAFVQGENIREVVQPTVNGDDYANVGIGIGKGEGAKSIRVEVPVRDGRLRREFVYADKTIATAARLTAMVKKEMAKHLLVPSVSSITVADHPHAPIGSWQLGDDILVQFEVPWLGWQQIWHRVIGWSLGDDSSATLSLVRSDSQVYGVATT